MAFAKIRPCPYRWHTNNQFAHQTSLLRLHVKRRSEKNETACSDVIVPFCLHV